MFKITLLLGLILNSLLLTACGSDSGPADQDKDTIVDAKDNCIIVANTDQLDLDLDGIGDACDDDIDGDGVLNINDVFPQDPKENKDTDSDTLGDNTDNCPNVANLDQLNADGDSAGDVCDTYPQDPNETLDSDNDGLGDNADAFPNDPSETIDADNDGIGDNKDLYLENSDPNALLLSRMVEAGRAIKVQSDYADPEDRFGDRVNTIGDVNGDGLDDFIFSSQRMRNSENLTTGRAFLIFGKTGEWPEQINVDDLSNISHIEFRQDVIIDDHAGMGAAYESIGDVNGDGIDDFMFSAIYHNYNDLGVYGGSVFTVYGRKDWSVGEGSDGIITVDELQQNGVTYYGFLAETVFGNRIKNIGDVNGDGYKDVAITLGYDGSSYTIHFGRVDILFGGPQWHSNNKGTAYDITALNNTNGMTHVSIQDEDGFNTKNGLGSNLASLGDFNNDGFDDFVMSDNQYDGSADGGVIVFFGRPNNEWQNSYTPQDLQTPGRSLIITETADDQSIGEFPATGDFNGDGFKDLALVSGTPERRETGAAGAVSIIWGGRESYPLTLTPSQVGDTYGVVLTGETESTFLGPGLVAMPDWDGDGTDELIVGTDKNVILMKKEEPNFNEDLYILHGKSNWQSGLLGWGTTSNQIRNLKLDYSLVLQTNDNAINLIGDINGDGIADFTVSDSVRDAMYIIFGFDSLYPEVQ